MATLRDVAQLADVSEATVSLVLNNRPGPKRETRDRVLAAAQRLRYSPNTNARNLATRTYDAVGLIVTDIENPFFGSITKYANQFLAQRGCSMILSVSGEDLDTETQGILNLVQRGVRGLIVAPTQLSRRDLAIFYDVEERGIPIVFVSNYYSGLSCRRVLTDYRAGSYQLTHYLLELGHRDIRFLVSSDPDAPISLERVAGFKAAYEYLGIPVPDQAIVPCPRPDYQSGYHVASRLLESDRPDALLAINDVMALGAKHAARAVGLRIPDELSVAGYDDVVFASIAEVPLTTVRQRIDEISRIAVDMLLDEEHRYPDEVRVRPELVVRASTAPVRHHYTNR